MKPDMPIGDLAAQAGVNPKTIRYYESIGLFPEPDRTSAGHRRYGKADRDRLSFVKAAQRLGMTLDEIREILALRDRGQRPCDYVRSVLRREVADIDIRIAELQHLRGELVGLEELADHLMAPEDPEPDGDCPLIEHVRRQHRPVR